MINFIIRQFAGKLAAAVSTAILFAVLHGVAWLAAHCPWIAATIDPQAVATWLSALLVAVLNIAANQYHLDKATALKVENAIEAAPPVIPVRRAEQACTLRSALFSGAIAAVVFLVAAGLLLHFFPL